MWPVWLIIVVAVAAAAVCTIAGVLLAVRVERRRHRNLLGSHHLARHLTAYHRPNLNANDKNYSDVTLPDKNLSLVQMPYGIVSIGSSRDLTTEDEGDDQARSRALHDPDRMLLVRNDKRGIKRSFIGHSLVIPKTRRQKCIQKVMPCETAQNSPLSAIIELTDSEHSPPLVTEIADEACSFNVIRKPERQLSIQWPLTGSKGRPDAAPTEVLSMAARASMLMRMGGRNTASGHSGPHPLIRVVNSSNPSSPTEHTRSAKVTSVAHNRELLQGPRYEYSHDDTESATSFEPERHIFCDGEHQRLPGCDFGLDPRSKSPAPRLQSKPGRATVDTLRAVKPSLHSIHASFDMIDTSPHNSEENPVSRSVPAVIIREDSFKTIDASHWDSPVKLKVLKTRAGWSARRCMIEPSRATQWRAASDSLVSNNEREDTIRELRRPASVATANPLQWDLRGEFAKARESFSPLESPKKGHKRQHCVRITNLPVPTPKSKRINNLPEVLEDQPLRAERQLHHSVSGFQSRPTIKMDEEAFMFDSSPRSVPIQSPFHNLPILTPTLVRAPRKQYIQSPAIMTLDMPRPDSDIFGNIPSDYSVKHPSPPQMPLSPSARHDIRLNSTPPSEHNLPQPFDSPILPSPALKSSALYPRKSLVKGPRGHCTAGIGNLELSQGESPLQHKTPTGHIYTSKEHLKSGELDLRRSVMLMRSLNSENRLDSYTSFRSRPCHKDGVGQHMHSGLCRSSCASSMLTISPILEKTMPGTKSTHESAPPVSTTSARSRQPSNSPSNMSTGAGSIWEDDSVGGGDIDWAGDSNPEDTPTSTLVGGGTHLGLRPFPQPAPLRPRPNNEARDCNKQHFQYRRYDVQNSPPPLLGPRKFEGPESLWEVQTETKRQFSTTRSRAPPPSMDSGLPKWHGRGHGSRRVYGEMDSHDHLETVDASAGDVRGSYPSPLVRNLERAVSSGRWDTRNARTRHIREGVESDINGVRSGSSSRGRAYTPTSQKESSDVSSQGLGLGLGLRVGNRPLRL